MAERTFLFIDLAGFTALTEAHGDEHAADLAQLFTSVVTEELGASSKLVKTLGDAVLIVADDPASGLETCRLVLDRLGHEPDFPVPRTGIHHGPAVERGGDFFGSAVNLTARLAAQAHGGQVLASESVADAARALGLPVVDLGEFALKNVSERVRLFDVHIGPRSDAIAIDPVCRMRVDIDEAAGRLRVDGIDYWFCSLECATKFLRNHVPA
jgi:class 3 adenylate cyclase